MYKGIGTCKWFSACKSHLAKLNLMKLPKFVSGYTEFTSFSARMNGHDGSAVRYTKQVRDGVPLLANFHKHEGIGYINDIFGLINNHPWFGLRFSILDLGPRWRTTNKLWEWFTRKNYKPLCKCIGPENQGERFGRMAYSKDILTGSTKKSRRKIEVFSQCVHFVDRTRSRRNIECPSYCGGDDHNFTLRCWLWKVFPPGELIWSKTNCE